MSVNFAKPFPVQLRLIFDEFMTKLLNSFHINQFILYFLGNFSLSERGFSISFLLSLS